jgi:lipoprotein signal peptidase
MNRGTGNVASVRGEWKARFGPRSTVSALLAVAIVSDQVMKWWAWRHAAGAMINDGGNALVGGTVSGWYSDPVTGAVLDLLDFGLLSVAVSVLVRRRLPARVVVPGALMIGGWSSNLLDRLGMHYWTAPGSVRGAVDFIPFGSVHYNVADVLIIGATPLFLLAISYVRRSATNRPGTAASAAPATHHQRRVRRRMPAFAGAASLIVVVGMGAAHYGGVTAPLTSANASAHH